MKILKLYFFLISFLIPNLQAQPRINLILNLDKINNSQEEIDNNYLLNQKLLIKQNKSQVFLQNSNKSPLINESINQNLKTNYSILQQNFQKNSLNISFRKNFKDLSKTYVSPFGKPINRAPDESLINCQSKECYE